MDTPSTPLVMASSNDPTTILSYDRGRIKYDHSKVVDLILTSTHLKIINSTSKVVCDIISLRDVIGSQYMKYNGSFILEIYRYETKKTCLNCCSKTKQRKKSHVKLNFDGPDMSLVLSWSHAINSAAYSQLPLQVHEDGSGIILPPKTKKAIVYVNPVGGKGMAKKAWQHVVRNMFAEAAIEVILVITERRNHAYDHVKSIDLTSIDFISTISGDGLIYEVINGLSSRSDGQYALATIPIAPLPGGSANGLVKSILFSCDEDYSLVNATFVAIKGISAPMDLSFTQTKSNSQLSFLMLGWGLVSDVDILSEFMRPIGEMRLYVAAAYFIIAKRMYRARLSLFLDTSDPLIATTYHSTASSRIPPTELPPFTSPVFADGKESDWLIIESNFILVWVVQTSHVASTMHAGPGVKLDDGLFTIFVAEKMSRFDLLRLLLVLDSGDHIHHPKVKMYKAKAYRLEPLTDKGIYALDGEVVEYGPIQGIIRPSAARIHVLSASSN